MKTFKKYINEQQHDLDEVEEELIADCSEEDKKEIEKEEKKQ